MKPLEHYTQGMNAAQQKLFVRQIMEEVIKCRGRLHAILTQDLYGGIKEYCTDVKEAHPIAPPGFLVSNEGQIKTEREYLEGANILIELFAEHWEARRVEAALRTVQVPEGKKVLYAMLRCVVFNLACEMEVNATA
jgi:hypothetical protein